MNETSVTGRPVIVPKINVTCSSRKAITLLLLQSLVGKDGSFIECVETNI